MHSSGEIVQLPATLTPEQQRKAGVIPIPPAMLQLLRRANKSKRRAWYRAQVHQLSQDPRDVEMRADERRVARNKRKKAAQKRRAAR